ncbi:MAG: uroporphyrinogen decarboxylase family protein [Candidatus Methanomethyliales bacterium]|nr:uroporphyrinogen decarboxylase family protein [Candidatus Methanomethylicales archaeon]
MTPRERVEAALSFEGVDFVPVLPPFQGFWAVGVYETKISEIFKDPMRGAEAQLNILNKVPFDGLEVLWDWLAPVEACGCKVHFPDRGNPVTIDRIVKVPEDIDRLSMPDLSKHSRTKNNFEVAHHLKKTLGAERYVYVTLTLPFTLAGELRGVEALMLDILKRPEDVHKLLSFATEVLREYAKFSAEIGVDAIFWCDPTASADLISPRHFKNFVAPYTKAILKKTRDLGLKAFLHICGNTSDRLNVILDLSPDLMSLDTKVDLVVAKDILNKKVPIMGNVSTTDILMKKPIDIIAASKECIRRAGKIGFLLGAGCDIPIDSPIENVKSLCDSTKEI